MYHSFSSWQLFLACPYSWHARYVSKKEVKRPDSPALIKGREVHKFMEDTVKGGLLDERKSLIAPNVYNELHNILNDDAISVKPEIDICCDYEGNIIPKDWSNPDGVILKIDLLVVSKNGITMIDYKTGASKGKPQQLHLYSVPFGGEAHCGFMYLDQNSVDKFDLNRDIVNTTWTDFKKYTDYVNTNRENEELFPKKECQNCRWCCVKDCPMARGLK